MLNLFNSFVVPGVEHVTLYHDDQDTNLFYMLPEFPSLTKTADGGPMFSLMVFARDFSLMKDAAAGLTALETEGGLLSMQTELSVSDDDQAKIRDFIQNQLPGVGGLRPIYVGPLSIRLDRIGPFTQPIKLSYPTWVDGKVSFCLIPGAGGPSDTFVKAQGGSDKPTLVATNIANYTALLGQEGETLFREAASKGRTPGSVNYSVTFIARIPSLTIHVSGNMSDIYQEIKEHCRPTNMYGISWLQIWSPEEINSLDTMRSSFASLKIEVDSGDWKSATTDPSMAQEVEKKLNDMVFQVIQDYLKSKFFGATFSPGTQTDSGAGASGGGATPSGDSSAPNGNQSWLKTLTHEEIQGQLDFQVTYRSNITVTKNPNCLLFEVLTPDQVKQRIIEADLNKPEFQALDVPVRVTADFDSDPIAAIKVVLEYNQHDDTSGDQRVHSDTFLFQTGKEIPRFQVTMAKDANGVPKDTYSYHSEIIYKASSKTVLTPEVQTRDRALVIGYNQLSCVRVQASLGAVPSDTIQRVQAHFRYPGVDLPTAEKDVFLSPAHTSDSWFTYTAGNPSTEYEYQLSFFLTSEERLDFPVQHSASNTLVVNAPFVDTLHTTFIAGGAFPPIASIVVFTRYTDTNAGYTVEDKHTFTNAGATWDWSVHLCDKTKRSFAYKVDVMYADGSADQGQWQPGAEGDILLGPVPTRIYEIDVIPSLLDFQNVWRLVTVRLNYQDPGNQIDLGQNFQITAANGSQTLTWRVPLKNPSLHKYTYQIEAFAFDAAKNKVVGPTVTEDPLLVLQL